ncbi:MAG: dUTP diphosphatase [Acidobacteriaceae bacterium]
MIRHPVIFSAMLRCKLLRPEAKAPTTAHPGEDLGYDLYAAETVVFPARGHAVVPTGIAIELTGSDGSPMGALVRDRSSMASRRIITTAGVIDAGYRGEVRIVMENLGDSEQTIHAGDKIANLLPYPVHTTEVEVVQELADSKRGAGGFGSSGKR